MAKIEPSADAKGELDFWFERARRELVHKRSPTYGVRSMDSIVEMLLDWGKAVASGGTVLHSEPLALTRESLAKLDESILALRRQAGVRAASKSDTSFAMAAAGFLLAVALHELDANVLEIAPNDGGCKVVLPSGAGTRPLLVAAAFVEGTGPSLLQTFDRLAMAKGLGLDSVSLPADPPRRTSSGSLRLSQRPPGDAGDGLSVTRLEAEAAPWRVLERPVRRSGPPALDLAAIAGSLATTQLGQDIAARSGATLAPVPASIEALESYCLSTRGPGGEDPESPVWPPSDADEGLILAWGALLGETLIAAYGGIWESDPKEPSDPRLFRVITQDRVASWPVTQVYLRLKNGSGDGLVDFLVSVGKALSPE